MFVQPSIGNGHSIDNRGTKSKCQSAGCHVMPILLGIAVSLSVGLKASAQSGISTGSILGFVNNSSGAVMTGTKVVLKSDTGYERNVVTDKGGVYQALLLPAGVYELTVE